ncbi:MAG: carboxypeptidase-like regulatory domain-containing protein [Gemmatimonadaceae bacterium]
MALVVAATAAGALVAADAAAQVTTGSVRGIVTDAENRPLEGARIVAVHTPSGTRYIGVSRADGRFNIPGMRVGGPYAVTATMIGYARQGRDDIMVALGAAADLQFRMTAVATQLAQVTVTSEGGEMSSTRTGAATQVRRDQIQALPTVGRRLADFTRLTPQAQGNGTSFAGYDDRLNNITVDGAAFNNSFGLAGSPGDRTRVAPISMDAIEAVQVNIAPFDVRQAGFVGAGVNTVTRSGTNTWHGALYYTTRDNEMVGTKAGPGTFNPGTFDFNLLGVTVGGPILKDKLFFFVNYEDDKVESPLTTLRANTGSEPIGGNVTRVLESDLTALQNYMATNFGRTLGAFQGYPGLTPSARLTFKIDYALSERNKFSVRYSQLESSTDNRTSGSSSLGFSGGRGQGTNWLGFQGSNYSILENIDSYSAEWNSLITDRMSNQLVITSTKHDESRGPIGTLFPFVDILQGGSAYTSLGSEPFTPNNELRYSSTQIQNNFTIFGRAHDLTFGFSVEKYESENVFFPGSQSAYVYNSLADFYSDLDGFLAACPVQATWATCSRPASPVTLNRFQVRWANIPGMTKPIQPLEVTYSGVYAQDEWRVRSNLKLVAGLRVDMASFGATGFENPNTNAMTFRDEDGNNVQYETQHLPDAKPLFSPRVGFNYDLRGNGVTVIRGGTGVFTGRPAYVWISNQIGENGMLTGFEQLNSTTTRPFHPDPDHYKPATVTGAPATSTGLAITDNGFKFPQVWRTSLGIDHRFASGWRGTLDFLWGRDVNGIYYINANLPAAQTAFVGPDTRSRWTSNRINATVTSAIVMKNQNIGESYSAALSLERTWDTGFFTKFATAYGDSKNTIDPGSIASGSWFNNVQSDDPNNPGLGRSSNFQGRRSFVAIAYTRDFFGWGDTKVSTFIENRTQGSVSYRFSNDANGDGGSNDLLYIPRDASEMNFQAFTQGTRTYTVAEQQAAWDAYINQDPYLRTRRGQYAERNGLILPQITRMDVSFSQDISRLVSGQRNSLQFRVDVLNFTNMINSDWGGGVRVIDVSPLTSVAPTTGVDPKAGHLRYTMRTISSGGPLVSQTYQKTAFEGDVWRMQFGFRYTFN